MTPKYKAEELFTKIYQELPFEDTDFYKNDEAAKNCALIAVDEIITALEEHQWQNRHVIEDYKLIKEELKKL